jgi:uncharacterized damage-inducible protein DinB
MTLEDILTLFQYDEWATKRTVESLSPLSEEQYKRDLKSSHGGIHGTLVHIYSADCLWLERWKGNSNFAHFRPDEIPSLIALNDRWEEYRGSLHAYLVNVTDAKFSAQFSYTDKSGSKRSEPLYQQMLQIINHASYHRGQIVTMLRQLGGKPLATDLILFYRTGQIPKSL